VFVQRYNAFLRPPIRSDEVPAVANEIVAAMDAGSSLEDLSVLPLIAAVDAWFSARSEDGSLRWRWLFYRGSGVHPQTGLPGSKHLPKLLGMLRTAEAS
jgi:hypothetical protein